VQQQPVMLFMKGSPDTPRCGFSRKVVEALNSTGVPYGTFDILTDEGVRQGLKQLSNWPTYPQVGAPRKSGQTCAKFGSNKVRTMTVWSISKCMAFAWFRGCDREPKWRCSTGQAVVCSATVHQLQSDDGGLAGAPVQGLQGRRKKPPPSRVPLPLPHSSMQEPCE